MPVDPISDLAERVARGEARAIARAISLVEDDGAAGRRLITEIYARTGRAFLIGVTGAPGTGKSTLVDRLIAEVRRAGLKVGVLAVDPTSPFSGGAVLGDRVRMHSHAGDQDVFIRSMATRGHLGGLARATADAALVLDGAGMDVVIIETVGVGQDEVDIVSTADVSLVLLVPGTGDDLQAIKAGVMEIADIFVVNKADREGADRVVHAVASNLSLKTYDASDWKPPIVKTEAASGAGVDTLWKEIGRYRESGDDSQKDVAAPAAALAPSRCARRLVSAARRRRASGRRLRSLRGCSQRPDTRSILSCGRDHETCTARGAALER